MDKLKSQNQRAGGVAVLKDGQRYIYYLVSKNETYSKPTYQDLSYSLEAMRKHMSENNVSKLAMPRIGCGIDGLQWDKVSDLIKEVFKDESVEITVYTFVPKWVNQFGLISDENKIQLMLLVSQNWSLPI